MQQVLIKSVSPTAGVHVAAPTGSVHTDLPPTAAVLPMAHSSHTAPQTGHLGLSTGSGTSVNTSSNNQQDLQAKILSLFNSGSGVQAASSIPAAPQQQSYSSMAPATSSNPTRQAMSGPPLGGNQGYMAPAGRMPMAQPLQRHPTSTAGINFDNPSVQKALDTLIQSGPPLPLVNAAVSQQQTRRQAPDMGQAPPMSMYPQQY